MSSFSFLFLAFLSLSWKSRELDFKCLWRRTCPRATAGFLPRRFCAHRAVMKMIHKHYCQWLRGQYWLTLAMWGNCSPQYLSGCLLRLQAAWVLFAFSPQDMSELDISWNALQPTLLYVQIDKEKPACVHIHHQLLACIQNCFFSRLQLWEFQKEALKVLTGMPANSRFYSLMFFDVCFFFVSRLITA